MSLPKYNELYNLCLKILQDGNLHELAEIKAEIATEFSLTQEEISERLPSGRQTVFANRGEFSLYSGKFWLTFAG